MTLTTEQLDQLSNADLERLQTCPRCHKQTPHFYKPDMVCVCCLLNSKDEKPKGDLFGFEVK